MKNKILYERSLRTCIIMLVVCIVFKLFGVKKRLREQIIEILGEDLSEEHINEICRVKAINPKVAETVYLYIDNSKDEVADILDIQGTTVIRRLKKFIQ